MTIIFILICSDIWKLCLCTRFSYYTEGNFQTFKAKGDYYLKSGTLFKTEVKKSGGVYATGNADSANFGDMMASFGLDPHYLPEPFIKALT